MNQEPPPPPVRCDPLEGFWDDLKYAVGLILAVFGGPAEIAARTLLRASKRQEILEWLAPIEAMARRILLLAALKAPVSNPPAAIRRAAPVRSAMRDAPYHEPSDNPADWRVLFSDWPLRSAGVLAGKRDASRNAAGAVAGVSSAYPLARRVEALIRLVRNPAAAIGRMANKIALRRGQLCFAFGPYPHAGGPVHTLLSDVQAQVDAALLNTS